MADKGSMGDQERNLAEGIEESAPQEIVEPAPRTRRNNGKTYNVLSIEEAEVINEFVKIVFYFKLAILVGVFTVAAVILSHAGATYKNGSSF